MSTNWFFINTSSQPWTYLSLYLINERDNHRDSKIYWWSLYFERTHLEYVTKKCDNNRNNKTLTGSDISMNKIFCKNTLSSIHFNIIVITKISLC